MERLTFPTFEACSSLISNPFPILQTSREPLHLLALSIAILHT